jgi:hypothetical protein
MHDAEKRGTWVVGRTRIAILLCTSALAASGAGCVTSREVVGFVAKSGSCPPEKLSAQERSDVNAVDYAASFLGAPIPAVAADAQRFANWKHNETNLWQSLLRDRRVFEIRGCTIHGLVACRREDRDEGTVLECSWLDKSVAVQRGQLVE